MRLPFRRHTVQTDFRLLVTVRYIIIIIIITCVATAKYARIHVRYRGRYTRVILYPFLRYWISISITTQPLMSSWNGHYV